MAKKTFHSISPVRRSILLVTTIALIVVSIFLYVTRPTDVDRINETYLDTIKDTSILSKNINTSFKQNYQVKTYTMYGESLKLYHDTALNKTDDLMGANLILVNVETQEEINYTFGSGADEGIKTNQLDPGLYEVYVYDHFVKKRVYFNKKVHMEPFETVRRNHHVKHISMDADTEYLDDYDIHLKKNYAFISVTENIPKADTVDVMIDPCGDIYDTETNQVADGLTAGDLTEQKEAYDFAKKVKTELEKYGLKVQLTRSEDGTPSYSGRNGRVGKGYEHKAKIFLSVGFSQFDTTEKPFLLVSPHTSGVLADNISYIMQKNGIKMDDTQSTARQIHEDGVIFDGYNDENDKYEVWPQLRESGGKATFAGRYTSSKENQRYKDNPGMYGIYFQFLNGEDKSSIQYYQKNKTKIVKSLAKGIAYYLDVKKEGSN